MKLALFFLTASLALAAGSADEIAARIKGLRAVPDAQRGAATRQIALAIRQLPAGPVKLNLASGVANLATEGDFGADNLQEVATTLAQALHEQETEASGWTTLAQLVRYEHVDASVDSPYFTAAMDRLKADDEARRNVDFTLTDEDGKTWTLSALRGKVVLVNFWATWCPPCRKEMPDLDALYKEFAKDGLVILALSDEPKVPRQQVSYPILLDPGGRVHKQMAIEGIPKSFVYNREGKIVAQSIDMRTKKQFLGMLAKAGLKTPSAPDSARRL